MAYNLHYFVEGGGSEEYGIEIPRDLMFTVRSDLEDQLSGRELFEEGKRIFTDNKTWAVRLPNLDSEVSDGSKVGISVWIDDRCKLKNFVESFGLPYDNEKIEYFKEDTIS